LAQDSSWDQAVFQLGVVHTNLPPAIRNRMAFSRKWCVSLWSLAVFHPSQVVTALRTIGERRVDSANMAAGPLPAVVTSVARRWRHASLRSALAKSFAAHHPGIARSAASAPATARYHAPAVNMSVVYPDLIDDSTNRFLLQVHTEAVGHDAKAGELAEMAKQVAAWAPSFAEPFLLNAPPSRRDWARGVLHNIDMAANSSSIGATCFERWFGDASVELESVALAFRQAREGAAQASEWALKMRRWLSIMYMFDDTRAYVMDADNHVARDGSALQAWDAAGAVDIASDADWARLEACLAEVQGDDCFRLASFELHLADRVARREKHTPSQWALCVQLALRDVCEETEALAQA